MDLVFMYLVLRDLAKVFRIVAITVVLVFFALVETPFAQEYLLYRRTMGVTFSCPQPAFLFLLLGIGCELILAVLQFLNPKLYNTPLDKGSPH